MQKENRKGFADKAFKQRNERRVSGMHKNSPIRPFGTIDDLEDEPVVGTKELKLGYYSGSIQCNYVLLDRWLRAHVGQPWASVYRKAMARVKQDAHREEFRHRLQRQVTFGVTVDGDAIVDSQGLRVCGFYVDAAGLLSETISWRAQYNRGQKKWQQERFAKVEHVVKRVGNDVYAKLNGGWFCVELCNNRSPEGEYTEDCLLHKLGIADLHYWAYGSHSKVAKSLRALSSKEIKRLSLNS